jgi:hypothetical protein
MIPSELRAIASLLLRFAVFYAILLGVALRVPLFEGFERPLVVVVNGALQAIPGPDVTRRLELTRGPTGWSYGLELERQEDAQGQPERRNVEKSYHAHGYVLVLLVALILATPGLGWRRRLGCLVVANAMAFVLMAGLLLSDVQAWEHEAFGRGTTRGVFWTIATAFDGVHRSSAAGLLPILLWLLYAASRPARVAPGDREPD